jgi:hypothetical protein
MSASWTEAPPGGLYQASQAGYMVEPNRGGAEEKRQITGLRGLPEVERSNHH